MKGIAANKRFRITSTIFCVLLFVCLCLVAYINNPFSPRNISEKTVCEKGVEYTIKLKGISKYDEKGFTLATDGFYYGSEKVGVYVDEDGFARTTYDENYEISFDGRYSNAFIAYEDYELCSEDFASREDFEAFFESPDPIYGFDINDISYYIQDVINYKKKFSGKAKIKIYREKVVITEIFIGEEKILELK